MRRTSFILIITAILVVSAILPACSGGPAQTTTAAPASPSVVSTVSTLPENSAVTSQAPQAPAEPISYTNPQKYSVKYIVTIQSSGFTPTDIQLYLPVPGEYDAQKDVSIKSIIPDPKSNAADPASGNKIAFWELKNVPKKNADLDIILEFTLTAYETNTNVDSSAIKPYDKNSEEVKLYTKAEKYVESGDAEIKALADSLTQGETDPYKMAKSFYDYIIDHTTYALLGKGLNGAKYLLDNKKGECGDYSALFIALCRAKGIPARSVVGYWAISGNDQTHVWAEFFLQGIGWIPVDATIGQQSVSKRAYYFGNMDDQRVILSKGYNTLLTPATKDKFSAPILQVPLWWYWGKGDASQLTLERSWTVDKVK